MLNKILCFVLIFVVNEWAQTIGPGLGNLTFNSSELYQELSPITTNAGNGFAAMFNGYLIVPSVQDGSVGGGSFGIFDISDPRNPVKKIEYTDIYAVDITEAHGFGFTYDLGGEHMVISAAEGLQIWDMKDPVNPGFVNYFDIPDIVRGGYENGAWSIFLQAPYVYVPAMNHGLYVIDISDVNNPKVVKKVPMNETGGFKVGPSTVFGNILFFSAVDAVGYSMMDISNPADPKLVASKNIESNYSHHIYDDKLYIAGRNGKLYVRDFTDINWPVIDSTNVQGDKASYILTQDDKVFLGASTNFAIFNWGQDGKLNRITAQPAPPQDSGCTSDIDQDFVTPIGNLLFVGNDHDHCKGSHFYPHQTEQDNIGPSVSMINPLDGALDQATTSRIGVIFSDQINLKTVNTNTFSVTLDGGDGTPLEGYFSHQMGVVNFWPKEELIPNRKYVITLKKDGIEDYAGNKTPEEFTSSFMTITNGQVPVIKKIKTAKLETNLFNVKGEYVFKKRSGFYLKGLK